MERLLDDEAIAPALWTIEVRNILLVNERRNRIEPDDADAFLRDLARLPIRVRRDADERAITALARKHRLTAYDAAYLDPCGAHRRRRRHAGPFTSPMRFEPRNSNWSESDSEQQEYAPAPVSVFLEQVDAEGFV